MQLSVNGFMVAENTE